MRISPDQSSTKSRAFKKMSTRRACLPVNVRKSSARIEVRSVRVSSWINHSTFVLMYCSIGIDLCCAYVRDIRTAAAYQNVVTSEVKSRRTCLAMRD